MRDPLDVELEDQELEEEIRLVAELMAAAASARARLSQATIDELIGEADRAGPDGRESLAAPRGHRPCR